MAEKKKELYFKKNGLYARTSHRIGGDAFIAVEVAVCNETDEVQETWIDIHMHQLIDTEKLEIAEEPGIKAAGAIKLVIPANTIGMARITICVEHAVMWSVEKPILYVVEAVLYKSVPEGEALPNPKLIAGLAKREPHAMKMLDFEETRFGIRCVTVDAKNGFCIDEKPIELIAETAKSLLTEREKYVSKEVFFLAEYDAVKKYKERGINTLLVDSKNTSEEFFDSCNRLGMLVLDQVEDETSVMHERSFPSVIAWMVKSLGREDMIRTLDKERAIGGICDAALGKEDGKEFDRMAWNDVTEEICAAWDFVGYPKEYERLEEAKILFPNRAVLLLEAKNEANINLKNSNVIGFLEV